jgi:hypothetical protein
MKRRSGYERVPQDKMYYHANAYGDVDHDYDFYSEDNNILYDEANYYSDYNVALNNVRAETLMRQLRRFAVEHRDKELRFAPGEFKYLIYYRNGEIGMYTQDAYMIFGTIYFDSVNAAQLAIDTFKDELLWYFTEYKDSL